MELVSILKPRIEGATKPLDDVAKRAAFQRTFCELRGALVEQFTAPSEWASTYAQTMVTAACHLSPTASMAMSATICAYGLAPGLAEGVRDGVNEVRLAINEKSEKYFSTKILGGGNRMVSSATGDGNVGDVDMPQPGDNAGGYVPGQPTGSSTDTNVGVLASIEASYRKTCLYQNALILHQMPFEDLATVVEKIDSGYGSDDTMYDELIDEPDSDEEPEKNELIKAMLTNGDTILNSFLRLREGPVVDRNEVLAAQYELQKKKELLQKDC